MLELWRKYQLIDLDINLFPFSAATNHSGVFPKILAADGLPPKGGQD